MVHRWPARGKYWFGATLIAALAASLGVTLRPQPAAAQGGEKTYRVVYVAPDDVLNIRAGPSAGHRIVGMIPPRGRGVRVTGECDGWCPVHYNGASGWVNGHYLALDAASATDDEGQRAPPLVLRDRAQLPTYWRVTGVSEGESLKVREAPSSQASVVHAFEPESGCIKLAGTCRKPWCQVAFAGISGDRVGWVDSKNLAPSQTACDR